MLMSSSAAQEWGTEILEKCDIIIFFVILKIIYRITYL